MQAPTQFASLALLPFLPTGRQRDQVRLMANSGAFGPVFVRRGRVRDRLVRLDAVMAALKITDAELQRCVLSYEAARRQGRKAILTLRPDEVVEEIA